MAGKTPNKKPFDAYKVVESDELGRSIGMKLRPNPVLFGIVGVLMLVLGAMLLLFDAFLVGHLGTETFASASPAGSNVLLVIASPLVALIFVFWPFGFLSQAAIAAALTRASIIATDQAAPVAIGTGYSRLYMIEPVTWTPFTRRWHDFGAVCWLPGWRALIGGSAIVVAVGLIGSIGWTESGVDLPVVFSALALAAGGFAALVWGSRVRYRRVQLIAAARIRYAENQIRNEKRQAKRRAALTAEQRAAEDAQFTRPTPEDSAG